MNVYDRIAIMLGVLVGVGLFQLFANSAVAGAIMISAGAVGYMFHVNTLVVLRSMQTATQQLAIAMQDRKQVIVQIDNSNSERLH